MTPNSTTTMNNVFSINNVKLIDIMTSLPLCKPKKLPNHSNKPYTLPMGHNLAHPVDNGDGDFSIPSDIRCPW